MTINYDYMTIERVTLLTIENKRMTAKINFIDDSSCKTFVARIIFLSECSLRKVQRVKELKTKVRIEISVLDRYITRIISIDEDKIVYDNNLNIGGNNEI
jgi:hypothetical protein